MNYAGFFSRSAAFIIDLLVLSLIFFGIGQASMVMLHSADTHNPEIWITSFWITMIANICVMVAYFFLCEGICLRASIGKILTKIVTVDMQGRPLPAAQSLLRAICKTAPIMLIMYFSAAVQVNTWKAQMHNEMLPPPVAGGWISLGLLCFAVLDYGLALWTSNKQTFHDKIAKTLVVRSQNI